MKLVKLRRQEPSPTRISSRFKGEAVNNCLKFIKVGKVRYIKCSQWRRQSLPSGNPWSVTLPFMLGVLEWLWAFLVSAKRKRIEGAFLGGICSHFLVPFPSNSETWLLRISLLSTKGHREG